MTFDGIPFKPGAKALLPEGLAPPFRVFVNGVEQVRGDDYVVSGAEIYFKAVLVREGRLGFWRWFSMFLGIANTYRANDGVDIAYNANGRPQVIPALAIETLGDPRTDYGQIGAVSFDPAGR